MHVILCREAAQRNGEAGNIEAPVLRTKSRRVHGKVKIAICASIYAYPQLNILS
ncbi:hypothetical protein BDN70DRAFT_878896 [Pholiota conissans]|uniref:Uncharacterized protein n=1 Tax=Pholiota conissans TaxID=109636 RepID=A0A9P5Z0S9_9AGAR|nr:hypothetical protein BDN70DRAFT_878896 [Pholiota conissans]